MTIRTPRISTTITAVLLGLMLVLAGPLFAADDEAKEKNPDQADSTTEPAEADAPGLEPEPAAAALDAASNDEKEEASTDIKVVENKAATNQDQILYEDEVEEADANAVFDPNLIDLTGKDLSKLPCLSVGAASHGRLINGVRMESSPGIRVRSTGYNYATPETIAALRYSVAKVREKFPNTSDMLVADISRKGGGRLKRHRSHQAGRDADISYYLKGVMHPAHLMEANSRNLDIPRTWALLEALMEGNRTEFMFIDYSLQRPLYNYVKYKRKAPASYLQTVFQYPRGPRARYGIIRHARGHKNHIHVRFYSPIAVASAKRYRFKDPVLARVQRKGQTVPTRESDAYVSLDALEKVDYGPAPKMQIVKEWRTVPVSYRVRSGDTLGAIASKNKVKTSKLMKWNKLRSTSIIRPGQRLRMYKRKLVEVEVPVVIPDESTASTAGTPAEPAAVFKKIHHARWHKVKEGDSLWIISKKHKTTVDKICRLNGIKKRTPLKVGRKLKVKAWTETILLNPAPAVSDESAAASEPQPIPTPEASADEASEQAVFRYFVMEGDTLYAIAQRFNVGIADLCRWNGLEAGCSLSEGRIIVIRIQTPPEEKNAKEKIVQQKEIHDGLG